MPVSSPMSLVVGSVQMPLTSAARPVPAHEKATIAARTIRAASPPRTRLDP